MSVFSTMLRQLRKKAGMTQPELAKKLGVSRSTISMYELGSREPDFETLEGIADIFNVDMNTLIGKENDTDPNDDTIDILYRKAKSMTKEQRETLIELANVIFREDFGE